MGRHKEVNTNLPPRMLLRHGAYYRTARFNGRQVWKRLGKDYMRALAAYCEAEGIPEGGEARKPGWESRLFTRLKSGRRRGEELMSYEEFLQIVKRADGRCEVTKVPFDFRFYGIGRRRPWAPSIDRIDPRKGYTFDNCRLVCVAANIAMNDWGADVLLKMGQSMKDHGLI